MCGIHQATAQLPQHGFVIIYLNIQNILSVFKMNIDKLPIVLIIVVHSGKNNTDLKTWRGEFARRNIHLVHY